MNILIGIFSLVMFILIASFLLSDEGQAQPPADINTGSIVAALFLIAAAICFK